MTARTEKEWQMSADQFLLALRLMSFTFHHCDKHTDTKARVLSEQQLNQTWKKLYGEAQTEIASAKLSLLYAYERIFGLLFGILIDSELERADAQFSVKSLLVPIDKCDDPRPRQKIFQLIAQGELTWSDFIDP